MALVENTKVSTELNFGERESSYPVYHYRNVYPYNGATRNITLTSAGEKQTTIFNIPAEQVNMGESYLEYDLVIPSQGVTAAPAPRYGWYFKDVYGEYDSIIYRDTGSQYLTEIRNLNMYNHIMNRLDTSQEDLLYNDEVNGLVSSNADTGIQTLRPTNDAISVLYKEPVTLGVSPAGTSGLVGGAITIKRRIFLKNLTGKHSFMGLAKDSLFPQETYLELGWVGNRIGFQGTSNADPTVNVAALIGNIQLNNIVLKLAVQQNQDIVSEMKQRLATGVTIPIPWVRVHTLMGTVGSQVTYNLTLDNKQHGQKIQRLIYVPFASALPAANALNTAYDHRNIPVTAPQMLTYDTELDNRKLQRDILDITRYDDYMVHKKVLKNTTYFNKNIYSYFWLHIDTFDFPESNKNEDGSIYTDGHSLEKPTIWSVNKYSGSADAIYNFAIVQGQKLLSINSTSFLVT